jgi:hypothetical protein
MILPAPLSFRIFASAEPPEEELDGRRFKTPVGLRFECMADGAAPSSSCGSRPSLSARGDNSSRSYSLCWFRRPGYRDELLWKGRTEEVSGRERERRGRKEDLDAMVALSGSQQEASIGECVGLLPLRTARLAGIYRHIDAEVMTPIVGTEEGAETATA